MSGGSYDYLCLKEPDDFVSGRLDRLLEAMANRLLELRYEDAAKATQEFLLTVQQCRFRLRAGIGNLAAVWRAVEWLDSNDWSEDAVTKTIEQWRTRTRKPPAAPKS